jgi:Fe2+ or Zn2+ uptake regulation protein
MASISDLLERLRASDWRLTPQRRVVAEVLDGEHVHLTAETVHSRAQERLPEISLATVYNTLNELVTMGEVLEVPGAAGAKRYDPNAHLPHHHLVCNACGELRDVFPSGEEALLLTEEDRHGFELRSVQIVFQGLCPSCS